MLAIVLVLALLAVPLKELIDYLDEKDQEWKKIFLIILKVGF